jgi:hypothetical protein
MSSFFWQNFKMRIHFERLFHERRLAASFLFNKKNLTKCHSIFLTGSTGWTGSDDTKTK